MTSLSDDDLLSELGIDLAPTKSVIYTPKEERVISGFEEIINFYEVNKRLPLNLEDKDIFERLYAVRLEQLKKSLGYQTLLSTFDSYGLLNHQSLENKKINIDENEILSELGIDIESKESITVLKNIRSNEDRQKAEFIGKQKVCHDFEIFEPLFEQIKNDINNGVRYTKRYEKNNILEKNDWFILNGLLVYLAELTPYFKTSDGHYDARTRLIYSNGTESDILMRSLTKLLYKDPAGRRILLTSNTGPLFSKEDLPDQNVEIEMKSGSIYVLQSLSENPTIKRDKNIIHKIGVTTGNINKRILDAKNDPTYLLADVELIASYVIPQNILPHKLEKLIHKVLKSAQLDISIEDRFGKSVKPQEWFLVSIDIINQVIEHIKNGTIEQVYYDAQSAKLMYF